MKKIDSKLKECPFCGKIPVVIFMPPEVTKADDRWWVECEGCGGKSKRQFSEQEAIESWNRRTKQ